MALRMMMSALVALALFAFAPVGAWAQADEPLRIEVQQQISRADLNIGAARCGWDHTVIDSMEAAGWDNQRIADSMESEGCVRFVVVVDSPFRRAMADFFERNEWPEDRREAFFEALDSEEEPTYETIRVEPNRTAWVVLDENNQERFVQWPSPFGHRWSEANMLAHQRDQFTNGEAAYRLVVVDGWRYHVLFEDFCGELLVYVGTAPAATPVYHAPPAAAEPQPVVTTQPQPQETDDPLRTRCAVQADCGR